MCAGSGALEEVDLGLTIAASMLQSTGRGGRMGLVVFKDSGKGSTSPEGMVLPLLDGPGCENNVHSQGELRFAGET